MEWKIEGRFGLGEWFDLGTHDVPVDVKPEDYFSVNISPGEVTIEMTCVWMELDDGRIVQPVVR